VTLSVKGFRIVLATPQIPPDSSRGRVDSELVTTAYTCCRGKPGRVLDLSVRSLGCTGPGDDTLGFGPLGPMGPAVAWMDSFSTKLRHRFRWLFPHAFFSKGIPSEIMGTWP